MNTPNKLTIVRFILAPVFLVLMMINFNHHYLAALIIFIAASITDWLDGKIARKHNLITDFGKFLDPIADKMLTTAAFLVFTYMKIGYGIVWILFIVLAREFVVTSVRLVAADNGKVVAANFWGKLKTVMQMVAIIVTIAFEYVITQFVNNTAVLSESIVMPMQITYSVLLWISAVLTFIAGVTYIIENREFIKSNK